MKINDHKDLFIWQQAMKISVGVYKITKYFPKSEMFGMSSQMQRSVVSISSNIAEGYGRNNIKEYLYFLRIASGSLSELETQSMISMEVYPELKNELEVFIIELHKLRGLFILLIKKLLQ